MLVVPVDGTGGAVTGGGANRLRWTRREEKETTGDEGNERRMSRRWRRRREKKGWRTQSNAETKGREEV